MPIEVGEGLLEQNSLWLQYKSQVWLQESPQRDVVHNTIRFLRSIRNSQRLAYVIVPITTGKFYYDLQRERPTTALDALRDAAFAHNYQIGWDLVKKLQSRLDCPIVYPADLMPIHQQWEQTHFQALWLEIISELCTEVHMCEGWEFSNGGTEEFVHVMQLRLGLPKHHDLVFWNTKNNEVAERERMKNIAVYNHLGDTISLQDGMSLIRTALAWVRRHGFNARTLERSLELLSWTGDMIRTGFYQ